MQNLKTFTCNGSFLYPSSQKGSIYDIFNWTNIFLLSDFTARLQTHREEFIIK